MASVNTLIKKHQLLETDIASHADRIEAVNKQASDFVKAGHFDADNIQAKQHIINDRYDALRQSASARGLQLAESQKAHRIFRDVDDEESWIKEKSRIAASTDYGKDLTGVQNLQKKHDTFDAEIRAHSTHVDAVLASADALVTAKHPASAEIDSRRVGLAKLWSLLKDASRIRRAKLDESLMFQRFSSEVDEESSWINEKQSMLTGEESPDTLSAAQSLLKKHEAFQVDLQEHQDRVASVCKQGTNLITSGNYQGEDIQTGIKKLKGLIDGLAKSAIARRGVLEDLLKFLQFSREADSIEAWIADKEPHVASEDFGKDLPSSQSLIAKQDTFGASLVAFQPRVDSFRQLKADLIGQGNTQAAAIDARESTVAQRWKSLIESSDKRKVSCYAA